MNHQFKFPATGTPSRAALRLTALRLTPLPHIVLTGTTLLCAVLLSHVLPTAAEEDTRSPRSYLGAGLALSARSSSTSQLGGNISARYKIQHTPLSLRTSVLISDGGTAIVPTVSVDAPLGERANLFLGLGGSFLTSDRATLVGDRNAIALQPGLGVSLSKQTVLYGSAIFSVNSFGGDRSGATLQAGIGYQF